MSASFDLLIRHGQVVFPDEVRQTDIGIANGTIVEIGDLALRGSEEVVDARGRFVIPGAIDTQVHFREPGMTHKEDIETGTRAAICGGVTTIFEMPNTNPPTTSEAALADKLARANGRAWCDYGFFVGASSDNIPSLSELEKLPGSPGIKLFMGSSTGTLLVEGDERVEQVMRNGTRPMAVHSEDEPRLRQLKESMDLVNVCQHPEVRDAEAARLCTERLLRLQAKTGRPVHVLHISTGDELPLLWAAKREGRPVTCEVTPQHLLFCADDYARLGSRIQMNPPIRSASHREALQIALQEGLFDVFGSDHAPHTLEEKSQPYPKSPSGMPGVQTLVVAALHIHMLGFVTLLDVVRMLSTRPAELYGIKNKGSVEVGKDADLNLVSFTENFVQDSDMQSKCGWTPYDGMSLLAKVHQTYLGGKLVGKHGKPVGKPNGRPVTYSWK